MKIALFCALYALCGCGGNLSPTSDPAPTDDAAAPDAPPDAPLDQATVNPLGAPCDSAAQCAAAFAPWFASAGPHTAACSSNLGCEFICIGDSDPLCAQLGAPCAGAAGTHPLEYICALVP